MSSIIISFDNTNLCDMIYYFMSKDIIIIIAAVRSLQVLEDSAMIHKTFSANCEKRSCCVNNNKIMVFLMLYLIMCKQDLKWLLMIKGTYFYLEKLWIVLWTMNTQQQQHHIFFILLWLQHNANDYWHYNMSRVAKSSVGQLVTTL